MTQRFWKYHGLGNDFVVVEGALAVLRQHREAVEKAIGRTRLELDAVALVVP